MTTTLRTYDWKELALYCPELHHAIWRDLGGLYRNDTRVAPVITRAVVRGNGTVWYYHKVTFLNRTGIGVENTEFENQLYPFGDGPEAAAKAKAFVDTTEQIIIDAQCEPVKDDDKHAAILNALGIGI